MASVADTALNHHSLTNSHIYIWGNGRAPHVSLCMEMDVCRAHTGGCGKDGYEMAPQKWAGSFQILTTWNHLAGTESASSPDT